MNHFIHPSSIYRENAFLRGCLFVRITRAILYCLLFILFLSDMGLSQAKFNSNTVSGNWSSSGSWTLVTGSDGNGIPDADDTVNILTGHLITVDAASACYSITITGTLNWSANRSLTIGAGGLTLNNGAAVTGTSGSFTNNGNFTLTGGSASLGGGTYTIAGTTNISGTLNLTNTNGQSVHVGKVIINSGGTWNSSAPETYQFRGGIENNGTFNSNTGTYQFNTNSQILEGPGGFTFGGNVAVQDPITVTNKTTITIEGNLTGGSGSSTFQNDVNAALHAKGSVMNTGVLDADADSNLISYERTDANQTIKAATYYNLTVDKPGRTANITDNLITVNNDFSLVAGALSMGTNTLVVGRHFSGGGGTSVTVTSGTIEVGGDWTFTGTFNRGTSAVTFNGTGSQSIVSTTFNNLTINKSSGIASITGTVTVAGTLTVSSGTFNLATYTCDRSTAGGTFSVSSGATVQLGANNFPLNYSTITLNSNSTIEYHGTIAQTVSDITTYGNLLFSNSGTKNISTAITAAGNATINAGATLSIANGITFTVNGNMNNAGTVSNNGIVFVGP